MKAMRTDSEVLYGSLGLRAIERACRHTDFAHTVVFAAKRFEPHGSIILCWNLREGVRG
jgi:hypothetical protein